MNSNEGTWRDHRDELFDRVVKRGRARKRRRGFAVSATVVALVLALGAGLYLPERNSHTLHVAKNPHDSTTTLPPVKDDRVLLIGDTVMQLAQPVIEKAIPHAQVDTAPTRQFGGAVPVLEAAKQQAGLPPTIVIHLGDNGPSEGDVFDKITTEFQAIMDTVGTGSQVYFLTLKVPRKWEGMVNSALYSEVGAFPNAHVLAWHDYSRSHADWFLGDGFHLTPVGQAAYAAFIRDGILPPLTTYDDPFRGRAIPSSGFVRTDDGKFDRERKTTAFDLTLFDDSGTELGSLPRAAIDDDVLNTIQHVLVVTDDGVHLEPRQLEDPADLPGGCEVTDDDQSLEVALCGSGSGINLLGDRIIVNNGTGWRQLIGLPPTPAGTTSPLGGHWVWASSSPDGRWVGADWSGECEVPTGFLVSVADGSVHTVTGEAGTAWGDAPNSGTDGWRADGLAFAGFGGDADCGTGATIQRGIYLVAPDTGARQLFMALTPSQSSLRWSSVEDRRTPTNRDDNEGKIVYAYEHFFDPALTADERAALIQGSSSMRAFMDHSYAKHASEVAAGRIIVDRVTVHGATADVSFHAQLAGRESPANPGQITGTAVLEDGTWKISRTTFCTLSANDDEACPPE